MDKDLIIHYFLKDPTLHQLNARLVNTNQANIISSINLTSFFEYFLEIFYMTTIGYIRVSSNK